jgi:hypothetical protein
MIAKKIMQDVTDVHEINRTLRHLVEDGNGQVIVTLRNMTHNDTAHEWASIDHLTLSSMWEERSGINEPNRH